MVSSSAVTYSSQSRVVAPSPAAPSVSRVYATLLGVLVLSGLDQTILSTALGAIAADLHHSGSTSWVFSAYLLASTSVIPLYGKLADRWGAQPLLLLAVGLFALGSLACGLSQDMAQLIGARALQGLGGGGLMTLTLLTVSRLVPPEQRGKRLAGLGAAYGLSTMVGPLLGALMVQHLSWRTAFLVNVPLALVGLSVLARARLGVVPRQSHPIDWAGAALLAGALSVLLLALRRDAGPAGMAGVWLGCAGGLLGAFFLVERRAADPVLPLVLFRNRAFAANAVVSLLSGVALFTAVVFLPLYLQSALHLAPMASALHLLPLMGGLMVASNRSGQALRAAAAPRALVGLGAGMLCGGYASLAWVLSVAPGQAGLLSACVLPVGLGIGCWMPLVSAVAQRSAPAQHQGIATATPVMLRALGGSLAVAAFGEMLSARVSTLMHAAQPAGLVDAMAAGMVTLCASAALLCLLAVGVAWGLPRRMSLRAEAPAGVSGT